MAGWHTTTLNRSAKTAIAAALIAVGLVIAVPVAFIVALFLMLFGHVVGGLILIGGSVLLAVAAVTGAVLCGVRQVRQLREMMTGMTGRGPRVLRLDSEDYDRF
jgi:hypothetical protein